MRQLETLSPTPRCFKATGYIENGFVSKIRAIRAILSGCYQMLTSMSDEAKGFERMNLTFVTKLTCVKV